MDLFTQGQANKILDWIPYTTFREWVKPGLFQWHPGPVDNRGQHRLYSRLNLLQIALCDTLVRNTLITPKSLKVFMEQFFINKSNDEATIINEFNKFMIITTQEKSAQMLLCEEDELIGSFFDPIAFNIASTVINLKLLKNKVDSAIKKNLD